jgi:hypothetical protein
MLDCSAFDLYVCSIRENLFQPSSSVANFVIVVNCNERSLAHFQEANCTNEQLKLNAVVVCYSFSKSKTAFTRLKYLNKQSTFNSLKIV